MTDKFNFNRFGKVVVRDFHSAYQLYGLSLLIMMCLPAIIWLFAMAFGIDSADVFVRHNFIDFAVVLAAAISSMKIYNSCNLTGRGNYFAMLPATLGEKFWSMMLYCLVVSPLVVLVGAYAVDTLLAALPFGPFKDFLWERDSVFDFAGGFIGIASGFRGFVMRTVKVFAVASVYMFANTIFKKNKFIKTVLWLLLIAFALVMIAAPIVNSIDWPEHKNWFIRLGEWLGAKSKEQLYNIWYWGNLLVYLAVAALLSFFTYCRLKKMQY